MWIILIERHRLIPQIISSWPDVSTNLTAPLKRSSAKFKPGKEQKKLWKYIQKNQKQDRDNSWLDSSSHLDGRRNNLVWPLRPWIPSESDREVLSPTPTCFKQMTPLPTSEETTYSGKYSLTWMLFFSQQAWTDTRIITTSATVSPQEFTPAS